MASVIPDVGREWLSQRVIGDSGDEVAYIIAVGDGTTSPNSSDTSLANELYRANSDDSVCTIDVTSSTGVVMGRITVSGGTEVPAGSNIAEIGLFASGSNDLLYREVRDTPITVQSGDRKSFEFNIEFTDG